MKKLLAILMALCLTLSCAAFAAEQDLTIPSRDIEMPATVVTPDGVDEFPLVVLVHGHGGSRDEMYGYPAIAEALAAKGIGSVRVDFSGCGESSESFQLNCLSNMKEDVRNEIAWAKENYNVTKLGIFGYSMGGRILLELLADGDEFDAVAMLAPAADNACFINMFGGEESTKAMYEEAKANGFVTFTTQYGQVQDLSQQWFDDLGVYPDVDALLATAAEKFDGPALGIWAADDTVVDPATSEAAAKALDAQTIDATGNDHSYSFYADDQEAIRSAIVDGTADFFATAFGDSAA